MGNVSKWLIAFLVLALVVAIPVSGKDEEGEEGVVDVSWADVESIDIYDASAGDFLDLDISALEQLAWEAYQAEDWETAAMYYLAYLSYDGNDGGNIYNLACCYGLMDEAELAAMYLERAVAGGFSDIEHINWDPDFDSVRETDIFVTAVDRITEEAEEQEAARGELIYTYAPAYLSGRMMLPENFDPDKTHTLLVGLHGYGSNPDRFITLWERFAAPDFIYVSPRAPYPFAVGTDTGYSWDAWDENDEGFWNDVAANTEDYVVGVVNDMKSRYNIDRVYLLGFSQGCGYAYMTGIHNPGIFDGLICFGGWLDDEYLSEDDITAASDLRVFIAHGTSDRMVEFEAGTAARDLLIDAGYDMTFFEFDGAHTVPEEALQTAEDWMKD